MKLDIPQIPELLIDNTDRNRTSCLLYTSVGELALGLNTVWMLLAVMLVFFMQPGFALVEAGFTRVKNTANILMKNFVDFMFGSLLYWFCLLYTSRCV